MGHLLGAPVFVDHRRRESELVVHGSEWAWCQRRRCHHWGSRLVLRHHMIVLGQDRESLLCHWLRRMKHWTWDRQSDVQWCLAFLW